MSDTNSIRQAEHREYERLSKYLENLDKEGWAETSYCADWPVLRVISHVSSNAVINGGRFATWFQGVPALGREDFVKIWGHFDSLTADQMVSEFRKAHEDYFKIVDAMTPEQGTTEVDTFMGKQPANRMLLGRLSELSLHSWDVFVARDRQAKLPADAVEQLLPIQRPATLDKARIEKLAGKKVQFTTTSPSSQWVLDFSGEQPALKQGTADSADLALELPAEEFIRLMYGRDYVAGARSGIVLKGGTADDQAILLKAFR